MRQPNGQLNGVRVHRLKEKYGTKGLPTAELQLDGMEAHLVGPDSFVMLKLNLS